MKVDPRLVLRWRDHHLPAGGDDEASRAERAQRYLGDGGFADTLVQALDAAGLASGRNLHLQQDRRAGEIARVPVESATAARGQSSARESGFAVASPDAELNMFYSAFEDLAVALRFAAGPDFVARALAFVDRVQARPPAGIVLSPLVAVTTRPVPRILPRRVLSYWPTDALVLIIDRAQLRRCVADEIRGRKEGVPSEPRYRQPFLDELAILEAATLPSGATRSEHRDRLVLDFSRAADNLGACAAVFEGFITTLGLEQERHANDNLAGDPMVDWSASVSAAPPGSGVTLYDRFGYTAYLADVREGSSITRPEKLRALVKIKADGKLPTASRSNA